MAFRCGITRSLSFVARNYSKKSTQAIYVHPRSLCVAPGRSSLDDPGLWNVFFGVVEVNQELILLGLLYCHKTHR